VSFSRRYAKLVGGSEDFGEFKYSENLFFFGCSIPASAATAKDMETTESEPLT